MKKRSLNMPCQIIMVRMKLDQMQQEHNQRVEVLYISPETSSTCMYTLVSLPVYHIKFALALLGRELFR